jgi:hypothetical protein
MASTRTIDNLRVLPAAPVLPGGRNFGQKAQKRPGKNKVGQEEFVAEFYQKLAEKGPKNIF